MTSPTRNFAIDPTASRHPNLLLPLEAHWSPCTPSMTCLHMQQNKVHPAPIHDMSAHATERSTLHPSMTCLHMQQKGPGLHAHMSNLCTSEHELSAPLPSYPFPHERLAICITCSHRKNAARRVEICVCETTNCAQQCICHPMHRSPTVMLHAHPQGTDGSLSQQNTYHFSLDFFGTFSCHRVKLA